ncbi:hypothetical protein GCM10010317_076530 [Streptomyces mirabilis]|uniref:hypothetical protein n=1 Tax=Streptomyces mirabilis TaxID=68239 RepID=UPI00167F1CEC|nr:hypothetical protein [Streptomyces mirabilis]GHD70059.1 hypothetical protein GCM10010317_076530 [Streptomyces mirabilis]
MAHRPYPNADRALRNLRHQQAVYQYGRVPQRYVLGFDVPHPQFETDGCTGVVAAWAEGFVSFGRQLRSAQPDFSAVARNFASLRH